MGKRGRRKSFSLARLSTASDPAIGFDTHFLELDLVAVRLPGG
jgi:hypothetical protein